MLYLGAQPDAGSIHGGQWEAAVEGTQNFTDYSDHGDLAQDSEEYSYSQPAHQDSKWAAVLGPVAAESVPMRRTVSKSSAGSYKVRTSKTSGRPRLQTSLSSSSYATTSSAVSMTASPAVYNMASTGYPYYNNTMTGLSPEQYLAMYGQGLSTAAYGTPESVLSPYATDMTTGLGHAMHTQQQHTQQPQHVDPSCTQMNMDGFDHFESLESLNAMDNMVFEPSPAAISPDAWGSPSSRPSSPDRNEDTWSLPIAPSPAESHGSVTSSSFAAQLEAASVSGRKNSSSSSNIEDSSRHNNGSRSSEGESARDHPLYKSATCQPDGFYHCPWEGKDNCNHKPEKLKCNYDKFVDSHLKPYRCKHSACENARFSSTACLLRHEREAHAMHGHGDKPYLCPHPECDRAHPGFGFPRQWNLKDHMRRVHHDDGKQLDRAEVAPIAISSSQAVSKGRKRKKESSTSAQISSSASSRKSSTSKSSSSDAESRRQAEALAAMEARKAAVNKKRTEFRQHKDALSSAVMGFTQPDDPDMLAQIQAAQAHFDAMSRISNDMIAAMQDPYNQGFPQQSG
ncbi:hypothetical protein SEUCBS139899_000040 [Sporothrix eucalyptigena]|uniref:C2H2-type domain-containing protein n=1 Tax=Sporothrix eucalyptigena TaxID=1812306 RepID=A0ABP0AR12_9PEZI